VKKVLLTGATGFVGMNILHELANRGVVVTPVVRSGTEHLLNKFDNISKIISVDDVFKENSDWWADISSNSDIFIHSAWYTKTHDYLISKQNINCQLGTMNIARGLAQSGIKKFVGIGTCFEYEFASDFISVDTPLKPGSPYASAKAATFLALLKMTHDEKIDFAWCRLFYLYGENESESRLYSYILSQIKKNKKIELSSGEQIRDFMHVRTAAERVVAVALGNMVGPINVCSGIPITVKEFAMNVADQFGARSLLDFGAKGKKFTDPPRIVGVPSI
jgi:dTDP-6-deoxy-L-talose 4-dehydrogenase (NAD+)